MNRTFAASLVVLTLTLCSFGQDSPAPADAVATFRSGTSLVLVDVITRDGETGLPANDLKREDFEVYDNGQRVELASFDVGAKFSTTPIALWFVVLCNLRGYEANGSGLFAGRTKLFRPALPLLDKNDRVGVAHWCDDGGAEIDFTPSTRAELALPKLEEALTPIPYIWGGRTGELALQKMLRLILDNTHKSELKPLPVFVYLYGDVNGMPGDEVADLVDNILETSGIVYGIRDQASPNTTIGTLSNGEMSSIVHYMVEQTGGQYLSADPEQYAAALGEIIQQLHFRYQLGFKPAAIDGKRHKLKVVLTGSAQKQHPKVRVRARPEYIPVSETVQRKRKKK